MFRLVCLARALGERIKNIGLKLAVEIGKEFRKRERKRVGGKKERKQR